MKAKICDCCKKTYIPDMEETKKYTHRISSTEGGKLHLLDLCPECLAKVDAMMAGKAIVVNNEAFVPEIAVSPYPPEMQDCCCCETKLPDVITTTTK